LTVRKITIVLFPDGSKRTFQFKIPRFLPVVIILSLAFGGVCFYRIARDYKSMKNQMPRLAQLTIQSERQKQQIIFFAERIGRISDKMKDLKEFDHKLRAMVNLETGEDAKQGYGVGGSDSVALDPKRAMAKTHKDLVRSMHSALDDLDDQAAIGEHSKAELHKFLETQKMLLASTPSLWPTKGWLSSRFGNRESPFTGRTEFHRGIDISTRLNGPVVTPADGIVTGIDWDGGYGRVLTIDHGYGLRTQYAHLEKTLVRKGQYVKRGETVALVGSSGRSTGPHLHYEVHLNKVPIDPMRYILN
jgi:murein DD-endopeptidase MepM/ murein hydrolase activator NlpD